MKALALLLFGVALAFARASEGPKNFVVHDAPKPLPELQFKDANGGDRNLGGFHGKVVLLNLWATWCAPCRREMPTLDRLQAALGGPDFEVVALSIDRAGVDVVRKFYGETGVKHLAMYIDISGKAVGELGAAGLPTTLLIDRNGREIGRLVGPAEWDAPDIVAYIRDRIGKQTGSILPRVPTAATAHGTAHIQTSFDSSSLPNVVSSTTKGITP
ncbi:MAG: TlpA family protein disulfide reductase [Alphaproteobacteria bacterium]